MIALAALALAAGATGPTLRPVFDRPYRLTVAEERGIAGRVHRFSAERRIVFRRAPDGVIAEVTLLDAAQDVGGSAGKRFEAAMAVWRGRTVHLHLSNEGALVAIDDEAALAKTIAESLRMAGAGGVEASALPLAMARDEVAAMLMPAIAGADAGRVPNTHPVTVPSLSPAAASPLKGIESVTLGPDAVLRITVHAGSEAGDRAVSLDRERSIDRTSGLVLAEDETQTIRIGSGVQVTHKRTTLTPPV